MSDPGQFFDSKMLDIKAVTTIEGDDWYLVSACGQQITAIRSDGSKVVLGGAELEKVRRWVMDRAERMLASPTHGAKRR